MEAGYKRLVVYQRALDLVAEIYQATKSFPKDERFGLVAQLRRAAVSIPSNIAEGHGKSSTGEYLQALGHARGSLYEVEAQVTISVRIGALADGQNEPIQQKIDALARVLEALIKAIREKKRGR